MEPSGDVTREGSLAVRGPEPVDAGHRVTNSEVDVSFGKFLEPVGGKPAPRHLVGRGDDERRDPELLSDLLQHN